MTTITFDTLRHQNEETAMTATVTAEIFGHGWPHHHERRAVPVKRPGPRSSAMETKEHTLRGVRSS